MACLMNGEIYIALFHSLIQYLNDRIRVKKKYGKGLNYTLLMQ